MSGMRDMSGGGGAAGGSGLQNRDWKPERLDPELDLDGHRSRIWSDDTKSTIATDADPVGAWEDLSGNGNDALQGTSSNRPTLNAESEHGRDTVLGDGSDDFLLCSNVDISADVTPELSWYCVMIEGDDSDHGPVGDSSGGGWDRFMESSTNVGWRTGGGDKTNPNGDTAVDITNNTPGKRSVLSIFPSEAVSNGSETRFNGAQQVTYTEHQGDDNGTRELAICDFGGSSSPKNPYDRRVCHVLVFFYSQSLAERARTERYLMRKWGIG